MHPGLQGRPGINSRRSGLAISYFETDSLFLYHCLFSFAPPKKQDTMVSFKLAISALLASVSTAVAANKAVYAHFMVEYFESRVLYICFLTRSSRSALSNTTPLMTGRPTLSRLKQLALTASLSTVPLPESIATLQSSWPMPMRRPSSSASTSLSLLTLPTGATVIPTPSTAS